MDGRTEIVRNFLLTTLEVRTKAPQLAGHYKTPGVLPASFHVVRSETGTETLQSDFGDRAIGRVAPVDSMMWWVALLGLMLAGCPETENVGQDADQGQRV